MSLGQNPKELTVPDINAEIQKRGLDFIMGMDTQKLWVNGIQAFVNPDVTLIVFREQNLLSTPDNGSIAALKNVASVVVPTPVFREFHSNIGQILNAAIYNVG